MRQTSNAAFPIELCQTETARNCCSLEAPPQQYSVMTAYMGTDMGFNLATATLQPQFEPNRPFPVPKAHEKPFSCHSTECHRA